MSVREDPEDADVEQVANRVPEWWHPERFDECEFCFELRPVCVLPTEPGDWLVCERCSRVVG